MGKRIITQRRGRGTFTYKAHSHRHKGEVKHPTSIATPILKGTVKDIVHCRGHSAPLALVKYDGGEESYSFATDNLRVGDTIYIGPSVSLEKGNTLTLSEIPEGTLIHNIEKNPYDGGKFVRCSGDFARVISRSSDVVVVRMPSKQQKNFNPKCRATIGVIAGGGRKEKPFLKAGKRMHAMRARNKLYPQTSGVAMNAVDHPFGSGRGRHAGKPLTPPRYAPPGRNVGQIRARKTGRGKSRKKVRE